MKNILILFFVITLSGCGGRAGELAKLFTEFEQTCEGEITKRLYTNTFMSGYEMSCTENKEENK